MSCNNINYILWVMGTGEKLINIFVFTIFHGNKILLVIFVLTNGKTKDSGINGQTDEAGRKWAQHCGHACDDHGRVAQMERICPGPVPSPSEGDATEDVGYSYDGHQKGAILRPIYLSSLHLEKQVGHEYS